MCTGKTEACIHAADILDPNQRGLVICYQPEAEIRFGDVQRRYIMSRKGLCIPSKVVADNNLLSIIDDIQENHINPRQHPYIIIDEGSFYSPGR